MHKYYIYLWITTGMRRTDKKGELSSRPPRKWGSDWKDEQSRSWSLGCNYKLQDDAEDHKLIFTFKCNLTAEMTPV